MALLTELGVPFLRFLLIKYASFSLFFFVLSWSKHKQVLIKIQTTQNMFQLKTKIRLRILLLF